MLAAGLAVLYGGGELLLRGAVRLARRAGVTPLAIGLVVVGFGTSAPELVTSIEAALAGSPAIAWGNIVGSNIANTLLILGAAAALVPVVVHRGPALRDAGAALAAALLLAVLALTGLAAAWLGLAMVALLALYLGWCYRAERIRAARAVPEAGSHDDEAGGWGLPLAHTLAGLALLVGGGQLLVTGAIALAAAAGMSETLVGLTVVAIGTSLPELVTSLVAARKGEAEVAFGNVAGSNIYNALGIGGATMLASPRAVPAGLWPLDIGLMAGAAAIVVLLVAARGRIGRAAGVAGVLAYAAFLAAAALTQ